MKKTRAIVGKCLFEKKTSLACPLQSLSPPVDAPKEGGASILRNKKAGGQNHVYSQAEVYHSASFSPYPRQEIPQARSFLTGQLSEHGF